MAVKKEMKMMKCTTVILATLTIGLPWAAAVPKSDGYYGKTKVAPKAEVKASPFDLGQVKLLPSKFERAMKINQNYLLELDADRMLWPYHERAGLQTKGERYGGWERKDIVGQTTGHYMSALSLMYASSGDKRFKQRVDYIVSEIARAQKKHGDGYTGPVRPEVWKNIYSGDLKAHKWGVGGGYVPWYVIHKTFAGLIDAYVQTDNKQALEIVIKLADWAKKGTDSLDDAQFQNMLQAEHGGMSESLAHLYAITGNKDYLTFAQRFDHKEILDPLEKKEDKLAGYHVNTQLPKILSAARLYELTGDQRYSTAVNFLWDQVINARSMAPGGVDLQEHFYEAGSESEHLRWNSSETCSVYNMLKLTRSVFSWNPSANTMDYYERALYNQILGSQDPDSGGMTYFYNLKPGHFKIYSTPFDAMWCCVGSGIENHSKYADTIYSHDDDTLWVNLFIPSVLDWQEKDVARSHGDQVPRGRPHHAHSEQQKVSGTRPEDSRSLLGDPRGRCHHQWQEAERGIEPRELPDAVASVERRRHSRGPLADESSSAPSAGQKGFDHNHVWSARTCGRTRKRRNAERCLLEPESTQWCRGSPGPRVSCRREQGALLMAQAGPRRDPSIQNGRRR